MMKPILSILILSAILIFTIANVSAVVYSPNYVYDNANEGLTDVSVIGFVCDNADCTQNRGLWTEILNTETNNVIVLTYPTNLLSQYGYSVYFYKEGYVPANQRVTLHDSGTAKRHDNYLYQITDSAHAKIENFNSDSEIKKGETAEITAKILSPRINKENIKFIPEILKNDYYSDKVKVSLSVNGNVVETKNLNMLWSTEQNIEFSFTPSTAGNYNIKITTEITDNKFTDKKIESQTKTLKVTEDKPQPPIDNTKPIITIISPENKEYDISEIKFKINANEPLSDSWFILNFGNPTTMTKISPAQYISTINLNDGNYELTFYAEDLAGNIGEKTIKFSIDTEEEHEDEEESHNNGYRQITIYEEEPVKKKTTFTPYEEPETIAKKTTYNVYVYLLWILAILCIILLLIIIAVIFRRY